MSKYGWNRVQLQELTPSLPSWNYLIEGKRSRASIGSLALASGKHNLAVCVGGFLLLPQPGQCERRAIGHADQVRLLL